MGVEVTSWGNQRGFGRFARNVLTRLVELDCETTYVFYGDGKFPPGVEVRSIVAHTPATRATRSLRELLGLARAVSRGDLGAFLFPSSYSYFPVFGPRVISGASRRGRVEGGSGAGGRRPRLHTAFPE